jgi:hypothetical protein
MPAHLFPAASIAVRRTPAAPWVPTDASGLVLWLKPSAGITLSSALAEQGTTPPNVTLSAAPATPAALELRIPIGGTRGTATFEYRVNGGTAGAWVAGGVTAASVALGATGFTTAFPTGTYNVNNLYFSAVSAWADQSGVALSFAQAGTTVQPMFLWDADYACPVVAGLPGITTRLVSATGGVLGDAIHSIFVSKKHIGAAAIQSDVAFGSAAVALQNSWVGCNASEAAAYGAHTTATPAGATLSNGTIYRQGKVHTASGDQGYLNGATDGPLVARTLNLAAGIIVGARPTSSSPSVSRIREILAYSSNVVTGGHLPSIDAYLDGLVP